MNFTTGFLTDADLGVADMQPLVAAALELEATQVSVLPAEQGEEERWDEHAPVVCVYGRLSGDFRYELTVTLPDAIDARRMVRRFSDLSQSRCALSETQYGLWTQFQPGQRATLICEVWSGDEDEGRFKPDVPQPEDNEEVRALRTSVAEYPG